MPLQYILSIPFIAVRLRTKVNLQCNPIKVMLHLKRKERDDIPKGAVRPSQHISTEHEELLFQSVFRVLSQGGWNDILDKRLFISMGKISLDKKFNILEKIPESCEFAIRVVSSSEAWKN